MTDHELLQMALNALERYKSPDSTIKALRARLAQPEPILPGGGIGRHPDMPQSSDDLERAFYRDWEAGKVKRVSDGKRMVPEREWVGLTAKDLVEIPSSCYEGAIWADAKLKEKNT
jgi:hypothetical protein